MINSLWKSKLNVSVLITFFRTLKSWKILLKQRLIILLFFSPYGRIWFPYLLPNCNIRSIVAYRFSAFREALYPVDETHSAGRNAMGGSGRMCLVTGCTSGLRGPSPPGFNPLQRGWVYRPVPEAPLLRGMPTGSEAFLEMPGACGLRPCAWPHPKKGLVPYSSGWWDGGQIPSVFLFHSHN